MTISDFALKHPVTSIVMSLVIILFGVVGFTSLGVRLYPAIDPPTINVQTTYTGANPEIIESQITEPLEKAINGIEGIKSISSSSSTGSSTIVVEFNVGADLEKAANDVRDKTSQAARSLPQDIDAPPVVSKADANSDPIITVAVQSTTMNALELSDYAENVLMEKLQTIPGVSSVALFGQKRPAMRLWLNPDRMAAYNLTAQDINQALEKENVELPSGKVRGKNTELIVKTFGRLVTEDDFNNIIIRQTNDQVIRLSDIGEAILGPENEETQVKLNGSEGISLALIPLPGANHIEIADEFYKRFNQIQKEMPAGMKLDIGYDKTKFVRQSVKDVGETLIITISLVILIVFLFFRNWVIAIRPLLDIPVSLIGSFFIMYVFGFSVNVLTMLAVVLATGLVVDDGIVVTENIFKKIELGMDKWAAAFSGTREILFAVISTSFTLAIVFIPVIFLSGFTGRLFREFGIVVAGAVLISAFVSLTLTPVLNIKLGGSLSRHSRFYEATEPFFAGLDKIYRKTLAIFIRKKYLTFLILGGCITLILVLGSTLKSELAPLEDHSIIRTSVTAPEGTDFDYMQNLMDRISQMVMDSVPEGRLIFARTATGSSATTNTGGMNIFLSEPNERKATQQQIYDRLIKLYKKFPEARIIPNQEQTISTSLSGGSQLPVQFVLQNLDFEKLQKFVPRFLEEARKDSIFGNVDVNLKFNKPELNLTVDRLKATDLGVNVMDISNTLQFAMSGRRYDYFLRNGKQYYVIGQVDRPSRSEPSNITSLYVRNNNGTLIQLDNLVKMEENSSPPTLYHFNRFKSATVSASLASGHTLGEGITEMQKISKKVLDESFQTSLLGPSRDFNESSSNISFALVLALILIYLILAAQFESFLDPFIIMMTVPLAMAGALLSLWITGNTLNIFSEIGMIMLIGIVTKNGILIVEFANQKRKTGLVKAEAAFEAAAARLRPILMTSLATVFGALPIALALGAGSSSRVPLGVVVVGGLLFALILTLFVIPTLYILMASKKNREEIIDPTEIAK
ncbi:MAG: efflux RND transporter permease subunit [Bacteroidales bacterium]|nr:efflux RND transporter permease subunit [Bacteroidales bacterium]MDD4602341.1 efflux RND transporter permease subunit [Bacteroidales bacterium]